MGTLDDEMRCFPVVCPYFRKPYDDILPDGFTNRYCRVCNKEKHKICWGGCPYYGLFFSKYVTFEFMSKYCQWCIVEVDCWTKSSR